MTTADWLTQSKKLGVNARSLERAMALNELESEYRDISRTRNDSFGMTKKRLQYFKASLQDIRDRLADVTKFRSHSGALQKSLETFESKLTSYKSTMRAEFDSLANEEVTLEKDLDFFLSRVESWVKNEDGGKGAGAEVDKSPSRASKNRTSDRYDRHVQLQSKIGSIDRQIANLGGRYGGWDSQDHDAFMRCWVQAVPTTSTEGHVTVLSDAQRASLLRKLLQNVAIKTEDEIAAHVDWFLQYNDLQATKKVWLDEWKQSRTHQRKRDEAAIVKDTLDVMEESKSDPQTTFTFVDREAQKERIVKWKREREEEQRFKELKEKESRKAEQDRRNMEMRKRQEQLRFQVDEWKRGEEEYTQKMKDTETAIKKTKKVTTSDLQSRQARDRQITQVNLARKEAAQDKKKSREVRIKELERDLPNDINVPRDPTRVLASTKAQSFRERTGESLAEAESRRAGASAHNATMAMSGRDLAVARRAVPSWSRGMS